MQNTLFCSFSIGDIFRIYREKHVDGVVVTRKERMCLGLHSKSIFSFFYLLTFVGKYCWISWY